ncbi:mitochondrial carrier domain-containing protein [Umbelopsis sp. AD052]|nr:mitochondrial carrier domain-containing protein [Umbelopsis sp. AD052]
MEDEFDYESLGTNSTMLQNAIAGALAGIGEHCVMYPVDSIKTRTQVITSTTTISASEAVAAAAREHRQMMENNLKSHRNLWRGVNSVVMGAGPAHALHFATYEFCKDRFSDGGNSLVASGAAGACATLAHDTLLNPFDVVKQRMQLQDSTYKTVRECARKIYTHEGLIAFYISLPTTLGISIPFQSIQFATYEYFRKKINSDGGYDPKTHMLAGAIAGATASSCTIPLDVVKTLLQTRGSSNDPRVRNAKGLWDAIKIVYDYYGYRGFLRGYTPRVLTHMPSTAISWSVYEYFKFFLKGESQHSRH